MRKQKRQMCVSVNTKVVAVKALNSYQRITKGNRRRET